MSKNTIYSFKYKKSGELKKLYYKFVKEYSIELNKGNLLVTERFLEDGINISPEKEDGEIMKIIPLKSDSELEIKLIVENKNFNFSTFENKDKKVISVDYKKML